MKTKTVFILLMCLSLSACVTFGSTNQAAVLANQGTHTYGRISCDTSAECDCGNETVEYTFEFSDDRILMKHANYQILLNETADNTFYAEHYIGEDFFKRTIIFNKGGLSTIVERTNIDPCHWEIIYTIIR